MAVAEEVRIPINCYYLSPSKKIDSQRWLSFDLVGVDSRIQLFQGAVTSIEHSILRFVRHVSLSLS